MELPRLPKSYFAIGGGCLEQAAFRKLIVALPLDCRLLHIQTDRPLPKARQKGIGWTNLGPIKSDVWRVS